MSLRIGYVVATHPEDHSVDVVMADDGARLVGVQVMSPNGSARTGSVDLPAVPEKRDKWDITKLTGQDQKAIVGFVGRNPVVVGFLFPQVNQILSKDPKLRFDRHQSDVTTMIDGDGNIQLTHPSGTYIRIGESPDKVDTAGKNADGSAAYDRNTDRKVNIRIGMAGGVLELTLSPTGAVSLKCDQGVDIEAGAASSFKAPKVVLDADVEITKTLKVAGKTELADVTSNGVDISDQHKHQDTMPGPGTTGKPVGAS